MFLIALASATSLGQPTGLSWTLPGNLGSTACAIDLHEDTPRYQCGSTEWRALPGSIEPLVHALDELPMKKLLKQARTEPADRRASLTVRHGASELTLRLDTPEIHAVMAEAQALLPDDPHEDCDVLFWDTTTSTGLHPTWLTSTEVRVCRDGSYTEHEDGHLVHAGTLDDDALAVVEGIADQLLTLQPFSSREPVLCPMVVDAYQSSTFVGDTRIPSDPCGYRQGPSVAGVLEVRALLKRARLR